MKFPQYEIILYVADQQKSRDFYSAVLRETPVLDVPGMTEFNLGEGLKLGLMPEKGIAKILLDKTPHPETGNGIPRCELYILSGEIEEAYATTIRSGAKEVSKIQDRDWGDRVGYVMDLDGHILAFATRSTTGSK
jgi:catechol 2,3-dioxygenase-like lactoylglutathione lyase family enzyme